MLKEKLKSICKKVSVMDTFFIDNNKLNSISFNSFFKDVEHQHFINN